ncbi:LacI family DNA-binding transcriptional regulator [Kiritimatiella glycovorans]|uniref:LacI family transcriptional regulator n=1 Tax=Kiritimatiella glycovorans TaxID=1307763 RepID=A0A0G3ENG8_9BACT|nr:LacI family DNA-binding transcriptional regulator [Kiritimatiella glycovorans]AKJ65689.1 LacI family transcriptional regulator [Kiritimatiella glycovorans]
MAKITLYDVALECDVNASTVSRALRNDPRLRPDTCRRIQEVAARMQYQPNLAARFLVQGRAEILWFIVPSLGVMVDWKAAEFASRRAAMHGYDLSIAVHHKDQETFDRTAARMSQGLSAGAIVNPRHIHDLSALAPLKKREFPLIFLDVPPEDVQGVTVTSANEEAARELVRHCVEAGASRFVLLFRTEDNPVEKMRLKGASEELSARGLGWIGGSGGEENVDLRGEPLAILGSSQYDVREYTRPRAPVLRESETLVGCFDEWQGEPYPARRVIVAEQDYRTIADTAVDELFNMIGGQKNGGSHQVRIPMARYHSCASCC